MDTPNTPPASAAATPEAVGTPPAGDTGNQGAEHWYSTLPEDMHSNANITKYKSVEEMARGHLSAVSMIGRDKIVMPKSDEEYRDVYKRLGMPETVDDYKFAEKEYNIPEEIYPAERRAQDAKMYQAWAHEAGLSNKQAEFLFDKYMDFQGKDLQALQSRSNVEMAKCGDMMNEVWGEAKNQNLTIANRALEAFFGKEVADAVQMSGLGRNFGFIQGLYNLGTQRLEELGIDKRGSSVRTPAQMQEHIAELQAHPAYFDETHPEHKMVNSQVLALFQRQNLR